MDLSVKALSSRTKREPALEGRELEEGRKRRRSDSGGGASADEERERPTKPPTPLDLTAKI